MKLTPIAAPTNAQPESADIGRSVSHSRIERAKAIMAGQQPQVSEPTQDRQVDRAQASIKRIKMRTQRSPETGQFLPEEEQKADTAQPPVESDNLDPNRETTEATEATKPLSPQFAALAKQKREIQLERQKLDAEKQALATKSTDTTSVDEYKARLKTNGLKELMSLGVTYDQLTEQILADTQDAGPGYSKLEAEIKALKEGLENQTKGQVEREAAEEQRVLTQLRKDADFLISQGDTYEMVREAGYAPKAIELIHKVWKTQGELMDVPEALSLIENELLEESLKFAKIKKVQSRLQPEPQQQQAVQQDGGSRKTMRTLTNRDGVSSPLSSRERAIAAFHGRLK